jgi:tryptophan synthase alpha chain
MTGVERIASAFAARNGRPALMPYLMGGFPSLEMSTAIGLACAENGADVLELGVPYADPLADGPVIHAAGTRALRAGSTVAGVLGVAEVLSARIPVVVMVYAQLVLSRGADVFAASLAGVGAAGLIVPDLPLEEAPEVLAACDAHGVALVPLVAPTTPDDRLRAIGERARGFLYTVSVVGTTGERKGVDDRLAGVISRAKAATDVPVAVGFGIATPDDAAAAAGSGADGIIIGSRLVRAAGEATDPAAAVGELVAGFAAAIH